MTAVPIVRPMERRGRIRTAMITAGEIPDSFSWECGDWGEFGSSASSGADTILCGSAVIGADGVPAARTVFPGKSRIRTAHKKTPERNVFFLKKAPGKT